MSTKHFIEKLLAEPHRPQIHEDKVLPERAPHNYDEMLKEEKFEYRTSRKCILHLPREYRRQIYNNQYPLQQTICHSRPSKCFCSNCNHDPPPWLGDPQTPRFIGKVHGYPAHSRRSYSMAARWDPTCFANNSLATRVRQQPRLSSTGGQKRKKRHRTAFTPTQLLGLENAFEQNQYSVGEERKQLASFLGLSETQIKVWFQNRRTKWKRIQKEAEETITDDDEKGNEADSLQHETRYSQYQMYNETSHKSTNEICACERMWPTGHVY